MDAPASTDRTTTAVTHDGAFRVIALRTTDTVRQCILAQGAEGDDARHLADVVTGTILVRLTMAPTLRVQGIVRGVGGRATIVGDSSPDGTTRGLLQRPGGASISLGPGALMQMMRTLPTGAVHQGVVEVPDGSVSGALMGYLSISEQITSVAMVTSRFEDGAVRGAGGYIVQLLPEVSRAPLAVMTERLAADFSTPDAVLSLLADDPATLMAEILHGMDFAQTQEGALRFGCRCSSLRVLESLATLSKDDIRELMTSDEQLHITCDYCGQTYEMSPKTLAGLLSAS
ncbi:MAG: Hsp33 family molecular chaperone HslO [Sandaracinaceae bacterium]|nr:Hsp33 family molecular chaperone HslO [Sandaracinaceae bacterium]